MISKKNLLRRSRIYLLLDKGVARGRALGGILKELIRTKDIDIIQFRDKLSGKRQLLKEAWLVKEKLRDTGKIFILNDHPDVALAVDADGLHIGQDDIPLGLARRIMGKNKLIGISCHNLRQAITAQKNGADYISVGPIFATSTKPEYRPIGLKLVKELKRQIRLPLFLIGGIDSSNIGDIAKLGIKRFAVSKAILKKNNIAQAAHQLKSIITDPR
ncbi:MAG: thiamine phosphate synthase [Candidatus Omnitrophica bacterium]|nr:thiamine phosphate synthase [Candidatus Omnitrophota bacterium]